VVYLARAHGCGAIAWLGPAAREDQLVRLRLDRAGPPRADSEAALEGTLIICAVDAEKASAQPRLERLARLMERAAVALLVIRAPDGAAARQALERSGVEAAFLGRSGLRGEVSSYLALVHRAGTPAPRDVRPPGDFRVLAIVPAYNEADVIGQTLGDLAGQGVDTWLIDNWSTDATVERARRRLGRGLVGIERFPANGPSGTYDLRALMARVEAIAAAERWPTWVMLHDADERRRSPWPGLGLRDALWHVGRSGFSCIDHVTLTFWPGDDAFDPAGPDIERQLVHFEFSDHPGHFHQRRAWKRTGAPVSLAPSAGHDVGFEGRRVYPYKFLLKHYPIRSQAHGRRKVLQERANRWNAGERALGWHRQYDGPGADPERFTRDPATLTRFDPETFAEAYLVERLSGVGVFAEPPLWATGPRW
jgi:hypothetical protein